jgi:hypothetical protein
LVVALLAVEVCAQENVLESDPLRARKLLIYDQFGGYAGLSLAGQTGTLVTDCNCEFEGGAGTGYAAGVVFERLTRSRFTWGVALGYENRSFTGKFREIEGVVQRAPSNGVEYSIPVEFTNEADVTLGYITAMPFLKYVAFEFLFARVGAAASYVAVSNVKHVKTLVSDTVRFPNGESATVSFPGSDQGKSVVLQDGAIDGVQPFQFGLSLAAGMEFRASKTLFLGPVIQYIHPITKISTTTGDFSVRAVQVLFEVRFII